VGSKFSGTSRSIGSKDSQRFAGNFFCVLCGEDEFCLFLSKFQSITEGREELVKKMKICDSPFFFSKKLANEETETQTHRERHRERQRSKRKILLFISSTT
jgi:hypothetical protein